MRRWAAKVRRWLGAGGSHSWGLSPYEVACGCGALLRGFRQAGHQVARCPDCGREVFILPYSPLPPVPPFTDPSPPASRASARGGRTSRRRFLVVVAALVFVSLALAGVILFHGLGPRPLHSSNQADDLKALREHFAAGQGAVNEGRFQSAVDELDAALELRRRHPHLLPPLESRDLTELQRQAVLLADLLMESLEEILRRLDGLDAREGEAVFAGRYRRKTVVFYTTVRREATGRYQMDYRLSDGRREARLQLGELRLLQDLPLQDPQLLLFGFRLAGVRREPAGNWVLTVEPDSGVLLTNPGAATAGSLLPPDDPQLQEVLRRQTAWLAELP